MIDEITEQERFEMEIENKLAYILGEVYVKIPWRKVGVKSAHKFFVDRINASSTAPNFKEFLDVFIHKCGVDFVRPEETDALKFLDENRAVVMRLLRKETTYIANLALDYVDEIKENRKFLASGQKTL